jgi:phenylpropionate dioxygenase-like ring-hydroxylating dioxygenase large terminal subunit
MSVTMAARRSPLQNSLADHTTPLLYNHWYVAGFSSEFRHELSERTFLGRSLVIYRTGEGTPLAFQNRCAHRSFPLSRGMLEGDEIRCRYHGAKYNAAGEMIEVPCQDNCPRIRLRQYRLYEAEPLVWIWMGNGEPAEDPPATPWLGAASGWEYGRGSTLIDGNYLLMMENLMDLSHLPFLHRDTFNFPPSYARIPVQVETDGTAMRYYRTDIANYHRSGFFPEAMAASFDGRRYAPLSGGEFVVPGMMFGRGELVLQDGRDGEQTDFISRIPHFLTPETQTRTHYWYFHSRNFAQDDKPYTERLIERLTTGFAEDKLAIERVQHLQDCDNHPFREVHFGSDKPTVTMRRIVRGLAAAEYPELG